MVDKYYLVPNYDEKHDFKTMYVYNMTNNKKKEIKFKKKVSYDSYINGVVDDKVYLFDRNNLIQYEIDAKKRKVSIVGDVKSGGLVYSNGEFKSINIYEFRKSDILYKNDYSSLIGDSSYSNKIFDNYYYLKNGSFYKYNSVFEVDVLLFKADSISNVSMANDDVYFISDNKLYLYNGTVKEVLSYDELSFNSVNRYAVYKKWLERRDRMPVRDENMKVRDIDATLQRLNEEIGLVLNVNDKEESDDKEEEDEEE